MEKWFIAHGFPYAKTDNGAFFWQTAISTGELTADGKIVWHEKNFFEKVKKELDKNFNK